MKQEPFWKTTALADMSRSQWESLCDGCGRCCAVKIKDPDSGTVQYTPAACRLLDTHSCRCTNYAERARLVQDCVVLDAEKAVAYDWLPDTCAYRLLARGEDLPEWHPLVSGSEETVHEAGISVRGRLISEEHIHPQEIEALTLEWTRLNSDDET